ncbi:MAG: ion channel [Verrucomicrobia bacterium]|nr:ion channel [Verrucomicrobiota bacterium]
MIPRPLFKKVTRRIGFLCYSAIELLASLILLFAVTPFVEDLPAGNLLEAILLTVALVSAGLAVGGRRQVLLIAALILTPTLLAKWTHYLFPHFLSPAVHLGLGLLFIGFVTAHLFRFIVRASQVNSEVLCAGISIYFMIGLLWIFAYMLVGTLSPGAFSFVNDPDGERGMSSFNAFYFSFTTLSTVGFGDITPVSKVARTLATMEATTGMFYMAVMISRLVSLYSPAAMAAAAKSDQTT